MKKFKNFVIGGIESKIFNLVVITMMAILAAYGAVLFYQTKSLSKVLNETIEEQKASMADISSQTMDAVVDGSITRDTALEVYICDDMFIDLKSQVQMIADYTTKLYEDPDAYPTLEVKTPDMCDAGELSAQIVLPEGVEITDPEIAKEIGLISNLGDMMTSLYDSTNLSACFVTTASGISYIADDRPEEKLLEDGSPVSVDGRTRPWYEGAVEAGDFYFTDVEVDYFTGQIGIECSYPVMVDGKLVAVIGADLFLNTMQDAVQNLQTDAGFAFIVNQDGKVIFSPIEKGILEVKESDHAADLRESENIGLGIFISKALEGKTGIEEVEVEGKTYYMTGAPINTVGWAIVNVVDKEMTEQPTVMMIEKYNRSVDAAKEKIDENSRNSRSTILVLIAIILIIGTGSSIVLAKKIVKPLNLMSKSVKEISGENLDFEVRNEYRTGDEIEVLADSFDDLSKRTKKYIEENTRITKEKERISAELNVATQIQADMLPRIFPAFPDRKEFDLYASMDPAKEVGGDFYDFFLIDNDHLAMVMADVSGKGVPAALFMVIAKTLIKNRTMMGGTPSEILRDVNNQLCEGNEAELFVTVWMAILTISTGEGIASNAGHEHPALMRKGGKYELVTYRHSPALAVMPGVKFREHTFKLEPGDRVFVYTDGVAEATNANNELFGSERLLEALNSNLEADTKETLKIMEKSILDFVGDAPQFDDITMLNLSYIGPGEADGK